MGWLSWLAWPRPKPEPSTPHAAPVPAIHPPPTGPLDLQAASTPQAHALLSWMLACAPATDTPIAPAEQHALDALDKTLTLPELPDNLLPRAAALIPQLIALVRQTALPANAIAERISRDPLLSAEVMRLASSPYYRAHGDVNDLEQAIVLIGLQGLQTVITRVVLKPIYQAAPGPLSARVAPRMWEHSEALARATAILAVSAGEPVFDAYLAGLLHNTGWTVALRVLDRSALSFGMPPSIAFAQQMAERAHRLFGLAAKHWDITPGFVALAEDARCNGLVGSAHPLVSVLQRAQQRSLEELSA
ncbi:MAG: HDOD domain-containing protein [Rhodoferax sp.]|nr:HDOD domain-containing protein [Rhodoferax sp.]